MDNGTFEQKCNFPSHTFIEEKNGIEEDQKDTPENVQDEFNDCEEGQNQNRPFIGAHKSTSMFQEEKNLRSFSTMQAKYADNQAECAGTNFKLNFPLDENTSLTNSCNYLSSTQENKLSHNDKIHRKSNSMDTNLDKNAATPTQKELKRKSKYSCEKCGEDFASRMDLKIHIAGIHESKKIFQCSLCESQFLQKNHLVIHLLEHEDDSQNKYKFGCVSCGKKFVSKTELRYHKLNEHEIGPYMKYEYKCPLCDEWFAGKYVLKKHMVTKHETKSSMTWEFECAICENACTRQFRHLKKHTLLVHETHLKSRFNLEPMKDENILPDE